MSSWSHVIFYQKSTEIHKFKRINNSSFLDESLQIGDSEELFLCNTSVLPMMSGTKALPNKGLTSCKILEMLGMGRDHERQDHLREVMTLGWCGRWICQAGQEGTSRGLWSRYNCPGKSQDGPDPLWWCFYRAVHIWKGLPKEAVKDVEKEEGWLRLLKKAEWSRGRVVCV